MPIHNHLRSIHLFIRQSKYAFLIIQMAIVNTTGNLLNYLPYKINNTLSYYSNSTVPGGLLVRSYSTRFTPLTSLMIRLMTV